MHLRSASYLDCLSNDNDVKYFVMNLVSWIDFGQVIVTKKAGPKMIVSTQMLFFLFDTVLRALNSHIKSPTITVITS